MSGFPKYHELICATYPDTGFIAGTAPCVLPSGNTSRSRLIAGGTLFRSVETQATSNVNSILLELSVGAGSPIGDIITYSVDLTITSSELGGSNPLIVSTTYQYNTNSSACVGNSGVVQLRNALITANTIITIPVDDTATWTESTCHLTSFVQTTMSGGVGLPASGAGSRTGPAYSLYHVASADTAEDGTLEEINAISEWDGTQWIEYPSPLYPAGSGSPALCNP